jgi:hypothetical protein
VGSSVGAENIAIHVETSADNSGLTSARSDITALSAATVTATNEMVTATDRATQSESSYAASLAQSSTATKEGIATRERFNVLMAENGNNMERVAAIMLEERAAEERATQASLEHTAAVEQEVVAAEELVVATEARSAATATAVNQTAKIPGSARTAANAVGILSQAALAGTGSMAGLGTAAGGLAYGIGTLVPSIAGAAAGIGALVTLGTVLYQVLEHDADAASHFKAAIGGVGSLTSEQLKIQRDALQREFDALTKQAADLGRLSPIQGPKILAKQKEVSDELNKINAQILDAERRERDESAREQQRALDEAQRRREADAQKAAALAATMAEETQSAIDRRTLSAEAAAEQKVVREERRREEEIRALQVSEDEKTALLLAAQADRDAQLADIAKRAADKRAEDEKRDAERRKREADQAAAEFERIVLSGVDAAIRSSDTYIQAVTRALLTPLVNYLESVAESQIVDAAAEAAFGNLVGAAQHASVAALAIAGARKVAAIGGLNSSGGGGSSAGGYGGGSTFTPNAQPAGGTTVINLITTDPYGRESINRVSWQLQRNGTLNVPIYPTSGVAMVPG